MGIPTAVDDDLLVPLQPESWWTRPVEEWLAQLYAARFDVAEDST